MLTFALSIRSINISVNKLEKRLRLGESAVIARIKDNALLIDAQIVQEREIKSFVICIAKALEIDKTAT